MMAGLGADDITEMSALLDQIQPIGANQTSKDDLT